MMTEVNVDKCDILLITNKDDLTSDYIVKGLIRQNALFYRLNTESLFDYVYLTINYSKQYFYLYDIKLNKKINIANIKAVCYRRPGLKQFNDDTLSEDENLFIRREYSTALEGLYHLLDNVYWINPIWNIRKAENKIYQLLLAQQIGFTIPDSIITNIYADFSDFNVFPKIIKPLSFGCICHNAINTAIVYTSDLDYEPNAVEIENHPNFIQGKLDKVYDIRITIVKDKIYAVGIDSQVCDETKTDWRRGQNVLKHFLITLPSDIEQKCYRLLEMLGLDFGAIDMVLTKDNKYVFLEINPNGQWAWIEKQIGVSISQAIAQLLIEKSNNHETI